GLFRFYARCNSQLASTMRALMRGSGAYAPGMRGKTVTENRPMTVELLTAGELAARLRIRPRTVQLWARRGRIPTVRLSPKVVRFDMYAVLLALRSCGEGGVR